MKGQAFGSICEFPSLFWWDHFHGSNSWFSLPPKKSENREKKTDKENSTENRRNEDDFCNGVFEHVSLKFAIEISQVDYKAHDFAEDIRSQVSDRHLDFF